MGKLRIIVELLIFLWKRKLWWMIPLVVVLLALGILLIVPGASSLIPFLYPLF